MFYMYIDVVENFKIIPGIKYEYKMNMIKNLPIRVLKVFCLETVTSKTKLCSNQMTKVISVICRFNKNSDKNSLDIS